MLVNIVVSSWIYTLIELHGYMGGGGGEGLSLCEIIIYVLHFEMFWDLCTYYISIFLLKQ